jgi:hypothetical protein
MQTCFKVLIAITVVLVTVPTIYALTLVYTFLDPNYYKQTLANSGVYHTINDSIQVGVDQVVEEQTAAFPGSWDPLLERIADITRTQISQATNTEFVTPFVDRNIDNFFDYLNGKAEDIYLYIPKQQLRTIALDTIDRLETEVTDYLESLPPCTPGQMAEFETGMVDCAPTEVTPEMLSQFRITPEQRDSYLQVFSLFLDGDELIPYSEFSGQSNAQTLEQLEAARIAISWLNIMTLAALGVIFTLFIAYFFAAANTNRARAKSTTKLAFTVGILVAFLGTISYAAARALAQMGYEDVLLQSGSRRTSDLEAEILTTSMRLISDLSSNAFIRIIIVGGVIAGVSFGIYLLTRKPKPLEPKPEHKHPLIDASQIAEPTL